MSSKVEGEPWQLRQSPPMPMPLSRNCATNLQPFPATLPGRRAGLISDPCSRMSIGRKSDEQAQAVAMGKTNMIDVVTALAEEEPAIQTMVAVRDKVIAAYEEILKMPI